MNVPDRLPSVDEQRLCTAITLAERSHGASNASAAAALREEARKVWAAAHQARRDALYATGGAPTTKEPRVNLDRLVAKIVLDYSLLRWFAYNRRQQ